MKVIDATDAPALTAASLRVTFLSLVVPCLNEQSVVGEFVDWCHEGLRAAGIAGEVLIVDSSSDGSAEIAEAHGATVIRVPRRGLGRAYIDALSHVQGDAVILGDCDLTYDFRELQPFIEKLDQGHEFVMGSRMKGIIEPGAMPPLHRYFGTPLTTAALNLIYGTRFSDIHCGMRALTTSAFRRINLQSQSWQYASEMIIKAIHLRLKTAEVPIHFYKDREGRISHVKRNGWLTPWFAGWITLRTMFTFGADFFLFKPGLVILVLGLLIVLPTSFGPFRVGPVTFSLHWMLAGMCASVLGLQSVYMGMLARAFYDYSGELSERYSRWFSYDRAMVYSSGLFAGGVALTLPLIADYIRYHLSLPLGLLPKYYLTVTGLLCMIAGFLHFAFTLLLHAFLALKRHLQ